MEEGEKKVPSFAMLWFKSGRVTLPDYPPLNLIGMNLFYSWTTDFKLLLERIWFLGEKSSTYADELYLERNIWNILLGRIDT